MSSSLLAVEVDSPDRVERATREFRSQEGRVERLPEPLQRFIRSAMPEVGDPARIRLYCCDRLPFFIGARYAGFTFYGRIYLRRAYFPLNLTEYATLNLLFHELTHVAQFRRRPLLFPLTYLLQLPIYGYHNLPAEIEARARGQALAQQFLAQ